MELVLLVVDDVPKDLEESRPGLRVVSTDILGLSEREVLDLATIYDVVEFSTAVKPLLLKALLASYQTAIYLDPDMYVVSPLVELQPLIKSHGIVLTPHFLEPIAPGSSYISEVHSLTTGVHNLGFCGVGRGSEAFLDWWWQHLRRECLIYPLLGLFVDQKWTDIGANLFAARTLKHYGYNVGPWNLHERPVVKKGDGWMIGATGDALRLLHFSGFDPRDPDAVSVRLNINLRGISAKSDALSELSRDYAQLLLQQIDAIGATQDYGFARDTEGRALTKRVRRAYRKALLTKSDRLPSPFLLEDATQFRAWKRRSLLSRMSIVLGDSALASKYAFPDEYAKFKKALPGGFNALRERLLAAAEVRR